MIIEKIQNLPAYESCEWITSKDVVEALNCDVRMAINHMRSLVLDGLMEFDRNASRYRRIKHISWVNKTPIRQSPVKSFGERMWR